jgi:hypothetical protein
MTGGACGSIVIESEGGAGSDCPSESITCTLKLKVPVALGVPDITPVEGFRLSQFGNGDPPVKLHEKGGVPVPD